MEESETTPLTQPCVPIAGPSSNVPAGMPPPIPKIKKPCPLHGTEGKKGRRPSESGRRNTEVGRRKSIARRPSMRRPSTSRYNTFNNDPEGEDPGPVSRPRAFSTRSTRSIRSNRSGYEDLEPSLLGPAYAANLSEHYRSRTFSCSSVDADKSCEGSRDYMIGPAHAARAGMRYRTISESAKTFDKEKGERKSLLGGGNDEDDDNDELDALIEARDNPEDKIELKKTLGLFDGVSVIIGVIIGSGIFVSPKGVLLYSGSVGMALTIWGTTGLLCLLGAICYTELGTMMPRTGGEFVYISEAFGEMPGFLYLWASLFMYQPASNAFVSLAFGNYVVYPFFGENDELPPLAVKLFAVILCCFLTWVNSVSTSASLKLQDFLNFTKILALAVIIGAGIYHMATGNTQNFNKPFDGTILEASSLATACYQGLVSFGGWNSLNFVMEELKDPYKNLPRAIMISVPLVIVIYFCTNAAYFAVLTPMEILASDAVAVTFSNRMLGVMAWIMPIFVACATFSSLNGLTFFGSRVYYASARDGHLPKVLGLINVNRYTPVPSLAFLLFMSILYIIPGNVKLLANLVSFCMSLFMTGSIGALLWLRVSQPNRPRPIKIWIFVPMLYFLVCIFLVVFPVIQNPVELGVAIILILLGIPVYYIAKKAESGGCCSGFMAKFTRVIQLICEGVPEEEQEWDEE